MIRLATPEDYPSIRTVEIDAFSQRAEADIVEALRKADDAILETVYEDRGELIGHIMFSKMTSDGGRFASLAPVAVRSARQGEGIGGALIRDGIERIRALGYGAIVLLGHESYYPRFGFSHEATKQFQGDYSRPSFQALELVPGTLAKGGRVRYAPAFGRSDG
jgi:putative acetyltransferase